VTPPSGDPPSDSGVDVTLCVVLVVGVVIVTAGGVPSPLV
jgi:hypothetical protein